MLVEGIWFWVCAAIAAGAGSQLGRGMARKLRVEYSGACYHVINRGNYRRDLFESRRAAAAFERCLDEACTRFHWLVHAYVLMENHYHFALTTPEPNLSAGMKWLQGTWAARFNRFRGVVGRPFQGRYKAFHVEPGHVLAQVAHYIHLNPLSVRGVTGETLAQYRWSSLHRFVTGPRPAWLHGRTVLAESGALEDTAAGWRCYQDFLALAAMETPAERERKFAALCQGWVIGSSQFQEQLSVKLERQLGSVRDFALLGSDAAGVGQVRARLWEHKLIAIAAVASIDLARLPEAKSAPQKVLLAALLKKVTSVSNRWLGDRLEMGPASSVSSLVTRFQRQGLDQNPDFRTLYSRFAT